MSYIVFTEPEFSRPDAERIQAARGLHDPHGKLLGPHVTLVLPTLAATDRRILDHASAIVAEQRAFRAAFRCAVLMKDVERPLTHVYLLPDDGLSWFVRLRDRLYTGPLERALRLDVPYIPHILLGSFERAEAAKTLADGFNKQPFTYSGMVTTIAIGRLEEGKVARLASLRLRPPPDSGRPPLHRGRPMPSRGSGRLPPR